MPKKRNRPKVFPVQGGGSYSNDWGNARSGGRRHQGTDIFAPHGTPVVAVEDGYITKMGPSGIGGLRIWLNGRFYYAHLSGFAKGLSVGSRVKAGTVLGYVGNTGDAKGTPPHLHFGYSPDRSQGGSWANPYSLLKSAESGEPISDPGQPVGGPENQEVSAPEATPVDQELFPTDEETPVAPEIPGGIEGGYPGMTPPTPLRELSPQENWETLANMPFSAPETQQWAARIRRVSG